MFNSFFISCSKLVCELELVGLRQDRYDLVVADLTVGCDGHLYRSNILRLCVLQVTQQSEKHLEKITNIDEFVRRIYAVIHSNDPIARALTLRYVSRVRILVLST
jgi:hypothetical protein